MAEGRLSPNTGGPTGTHATTPAPASAPLSLLWIGPEACTPVPLPTDWTAETLPEHGFAWIDAHYDPPRAWVSLAQQLTGVTLLDEHLEDTEIESHPSFYDATHQYELLICRALAFRPDPDRTEPIRIRTRPTVFLLFPRCVVSIRPADSHQIPALRQRLLDGSGHAQRPPARPEALMLRMLNGLVDRYLELRQPLTDQLETWQRELLDPRRPFRDWVALLEARRQLRILENLSEEQLDALQEWRDARRDRHGEGGVHSGLLTAPTGLLPLSEALEVRASDLEEHIERVRNHAQRLETSVESAVQLHFSATAYRTNQIMRTLTVLTAVFMPLTLITGIFGMNFEVMPGTHSPRGFWYTMAAMVGVAIGLVAFFRARRFIEEGGGRGVRRGRKGR